MTNNFGFFAESSGWGADAAALYARLNTVTEPAVITIDLQGAQSMILAYPVYTMGSRSETGRATLGFILSPDSLLAYTHTLIGYFDGHILLEFKGHTMTIPGTADPMDIGESLTHNALTAVSRDGAVTLSMTASSSSGIVILEVVNAIYIVLAALLVFTAAGFIGYHNYRPIRRLFRKYPLLRSANEIDGIESYVDSLLTQMDAIETQRQEQYETIKQQTLRLLVGGGGEASGEAAEDKGKYRVHEVLRYVMEHYTDSSLSLDRLSEVFKLSNRYLSSMIREATGLSYVEFLTGVRIRKAGELLRDGSRTVTEVCSAVGYANLPHFTKTFKRVTGVTPSQFTGEPGDHAK